MSMPAAWGLKTWSGPVRAGGCGGGGVEGRGGRKKSVGGVMATSERRAQMQPSRGGGSDGKTCRLPHGIRTGPVTSPVVASSRDQPHQRAHGTNAGTVTTTHGPPGRIAGNTPAVPVPSKRVAAQPPKPLTKEHHGG